MLSFPVILRKTEDVRKILPGPGVLFVVITMWVQSNHVSVDLQYTKHSMCSILLWLQMGLPYHSVGN